jgi:hypothetical protein
MYWQLGIVKLGVSALPDSVVRSQTRTGIFRISFFQADCMRDLLRGFNPGFMPCGFLAGFSACTVRLASAAALPQLRCWTGRGINPACPINLRLRFVVAR